MSVKGMMQTVLVTELKQIQPDISDDVLKHVMASFSHVWDERDALAAQVAVFVSLIKEAAEADDSKDFLGHVWHDKYYDECTAAQCLAEIKAEAVEDALAETYDEIRYRIGKDFANNIETIISDYVAKIRKREL